MEELCPASGINFETILDHWHCYDPKPSFKKKKTIQYSLVGNIKKK